MRPLPALVLGAQHHTAARPPAVLVPTPARSTTSALPRSFRLGRQEDAHEFLIALLDAMHEASISHMQPKPPPELAHTSFIYRIFGGRMRSQAGAGSAAGAGAAVGCGGGGCACPGCDAGSGSPPRLPPAPGTPPTLPPTRPHFLPAAGQVQRVRVREQHLRPLHRPQPGDHARPVGAARPGALHRRCARGREGAGGSVHRCRAGALQAGAQGCRR